MRKTLLFLLLLLALFVLEAAIVWRPFASRLIAYDSGKGHAKSAGQILTGFHLTQTVPGNLFHPHLPRRSITHWHKSNARLYTKYPNCFAIRFATNLRRNAGHILVGWKQGTKSQLWRVDASSLRDNKFVDFCPSTALDSNQSFQVSVDGVDSTDGHAATLWLAKTKLDPALINGKPTGDRSMELQLTYRHKVGRLEILRLDRGAFAFASLCSLIIGTIALLAALRWRKLKLQQDGAA
jgi:hypothetical protein